MPKVSAKRKAYIKNLGDYAQKKQKALTVGCMTLCDGKSHKHVIHFHANQLDRYL